MLSINSVQMSFDLRTVGYSWTGKITCTACSPLVVGLGEAVAKRYADKLYGSEAGKVTCDRCGKLLVEVRS